MEDQVTESFAPGHSPGLRSRRIKAILAGGLVLGVGAAVTLAAWNDSEFAQGTFTAGTFNLEGSLDGTAYSEHASAGTAATLDFTVEPTALSPGDVVYAPFAVRLDATTVYDGEVTISNSATTGVVTNLTYQLIQPTSFGCSSSTTGDTLVAAATAISTVPAATTFNVAQGAGASAGDPVFLCFVVTAGPLIAQGQTGSATWEFAAVSQ